MSHRAHARQAAAAVPVAPRSHPLERAARRLRAPSSHRTAAHALPGPLPLEGGQPMQHGDRAPFERHYGCDFAQVRVHADAQAAHAAAGLRAMAFTSGTHIGFAAGRYRPDTDAGRALLGHELAHVAQVQAAGATGQAAHLVWRAPDDEAVVDMEEQPPAPQLSLAVTTSAEEAASSYTNLNEPDAPVDETGTAIYEGDVFTLRLQDSGGEDLPIDFGALPGALERVEGSDDRRPLLRVKAGAGEVALPLRAAGDAGGPSAVVALRLQPRPAPAGTLDPAQAANEAALDALRDERRASRRARRAERKALRGEPADTRRAARRARRAQRRDERQRARALRRERRALRDASDCSLQTQHDLDAAQRRGVQVCDAALAALGRRPLPDGARTGLQTYLKIASPGADEAAAVVQRVVDVLSTARNSLAEANRLRFICGECKETTGAFVSQNTRGGMVTICPLWRQGTGLKFGPAPGIDEARAFALVHEFVHLSGPSVEDERYVSDAKDWAAITPAQALRMADAYAALAWAAGSGRTP